MVLLAKWLLEHDPGARILVITDRDELDEQIEGVIRNAGVIGTEAPLPRIQPRRDLVDKLGCASPRLMRALIHKTRSTRIAGHCEVGGAHVRFGDHLDLSLSAVHGRPKSARPHASPEALCGTGPD